MTTTLGRYPELTDYGLIGDCRTAALVSREGSIDWWCTPRFDSPSTFARLLDHDKGGHFLLRPLGPGVPTVAYEAHTNVLRTDWRCPTGRLRVHDFMPFPAGESGSNIVRVAEATSGRVTLSLELAPRPDYARTRPQIVEQGRHAATWDGDQPLTLGASVPLDVDGGTVHAHLDLHEGEQACFMLGSLRADEGAADATDLLKRTQASWAAWSVGCPYDGPYREEVMRSVLALKLLAHEPTGAVIAAPTMSLPEDVGGVRNWDYRYAWLRDAAFAVTALHHTGHAGEAYAYMDWVARVVCEHGEDVQIMYRVDGSSDLEERTLPHLEGYRASRPVRVGNAASGQLQLDVYGEALDCLHGCRVMGMPFEERHRNAIRTLVEGVVKRWREPDHGIWEMRAKPRHFVYSKLMAWVALDRGVKAIEDGALAGPIEGWRAIREEIRRDIIASYDEALDSFPQAYGTPALDAANLLLPLSGFLPPEDPRVTSTVEAIERGLVADGMVYRYLGVDDGVPGGEATFAVCTFWLVEALVSIGRRQDAKALFERMLDKASPLGLYAEEIDPREGTHLGNYPQALTHIGLINAALALDQAATSRDAPPRRELAKAHEPWGGGAA